MRYGLAMFGMSKAFRENPEGFLKTMSEAGYRYLEPCLYEESIPMLAPFTWTAEDWENYAPLLEKYGFFTDSIHVFPLDLSARLPEYIKLCKQHHVHQLVLPCRKQENYTAYLKELTDAAELLEKEGIELLLHNGKDVSEEYLDGVSIYEWVLQNCSAKVYAQADVGWLLYGGTDPETFLWRNQNIVKSLHYKDFDAENREVPIGTGRVDMTACFQFARAVEIIQLADQDTVDFPADPQRTMDMFRGLAGHREKTSSTLCILDTVTGEVTHLHTFENRVMEAPNWMQTDDDSLIYNSEGRIYRYSISRDEETCIDTGHCVNCNNDHVLSPDETEIAVSHSEEGWMSQIYILPISGGEPRLITPKAPSFLHGWSPDGKELAYCAFRDHGKGFEIDVFAISSQGGEEWQLTRSAAFNDGPEYAPNGKHIWFNSTRTGLMQCWRMDRDGGNPTQMTFTDRNNWFPHVSPDGKQVLYLSYNRDGLDANEHLPNMQVQLRLMDYDGSNDRCILEFFGGQGSVNVNSWSRDSRRVAFVKYELHHT